METKEHCRAIDYVEDDSEQFVIYTFDCSTFNLDKRISGAELRGSNTYEEDRDRKISVLGGAPIISHDYNKIGKDTVFNSDIGLVALQWELPDHFLPLSRKGVKLYHLGKWGEAKAIYECMFKLRSEEKEGAGGVLFDFMDKHSFVSPVDWNGYRKIS